MLWNGTDRQRPQPLEWLVKDYDDTSIDKGSQAHETNSSKTDSDGTKHYETLELIYSIWTREEKPLE